jgi:hypothetical protein
MAKRQRSQQEEISEAEDNRVGADGQRERERDDGGVARALE